MSAPLYLIAACLNMERAYIQYLDSDDLDVLRDAVTALMDAARQAEPVRLASVMVKDERFTDEEVARYLQRGD